MVHTIDRATVEETIGREWPWFVEGVPPEKDRHFGVCPYCDNPVRLKALYKKTESSPRAYGEHTGKPQPGFFFDARRHQYCPYVLKKTTRDKSERRGFDPMAEEIIETVVSQFDRIIVILKDDYGFPISQKLAEDMLRGWFGLEGYLYTGAHLRNAPWMVGYFGGSASLYGRILAPYPELADAITKNVKGAIIDENGQLQRDGPWFDVKMQTLGHRAVLKDQELVETMTVRVQDFTKAKEPGAAPVLHNSKITFNPKRFEALVNSTSPRVQRHTSLLEIAKKVEEEYR